MICRPPRHLRHATPQHATRTPATAPTATRQRHRRHRHRRRRCTPTRRPGHLQPAATLAVKVTGWVLPALGGSGRAARAQAAQLCCVGARTGKFGTHQVADTKEGGSSRVEITHDGAPQQFRRLYLLLATTTADSVLVGDCAVGSAPPRHQHMGNHGTRRQLRPTSLVVDGVLGSPLMNSRHVAQAVGRQCHCQRSVAPCAQLPRRHHAGTSQAHAAADTATGTINKVSLAAAAAHRRGSKGRAS